MARRQFAVDICKQQLTFSAAHFITFAGSICERLHGHNYGVSCRVEGPLDVNRYVIDFIALRDQLAAVSQRLDHHVLLPTGHPQIQVQEDPAAAEVIARFEQRRWVFPAEDCVLLPVTNTTAEEIASYFVDQLLATLGQHWRLELTSLTVRIDENQGQWGECRWEP
jgi:6-pyruvoyltetrahydropterin/6-carboxytetrahydropterin synthase